MKRPITKFLKKAAIAAALAMMPAAALASEAAVVMLAKNGSTYQREFGIRILFFSAKQKT